MGRFMKSLITISLLALSMSSFSCPDLSGTYLCPERVEDGEVYPAYTITIKQNKNRLSFFEDNVKNSEDIIADGSLSLVDQTPIAWSCSDSAFQGLIDGNTAEDGSGYKIEGISSISIENNNLVLAYIVNFHLPIGIEEVVNSKTICKRR